MLLQDMYFEITADDIRRAELRRTLPDFDSCKDCLLGPKMIEAFGCNTTVGMYAVYPEPAGPNRFLSAGIFLPEVAKNAVRAFMHGEPVTPFNFWLYATD